jgi:hypothetical protein
MKNKCNCCQRNKFVFCFTDGGYNVIQCKNCDTYHIIDLDNIEIEYHLDLEDTTIMFNNNSALIDLCGEKIKENDE